VAVCFGRDRIEEMGNSGSCSREALEATTTEKVAGMKRNRRRAAVRGAGKNGAQHGRNMVGNVAQRRRGK